MEFKKITNDFLNETLYVGEHESGLPVVILQKKDFVKYYAVISAKYGSNNAEFRKSGENDFSSVPDGTAHFLEHKLFEQPDGTNAFDKFSQFGANANAYTSFSNTAYLFSATSNFYESLEHLLDYVFTPYFTEENVEKEQGIIGQEIRMYDDDPDWRVFFNMLRGMYVNHPIKKDIAGTVESIADITHETLLDTYKLFYHPENMVLFMAGNIDIEKAGEVVDKTVVKRENGFDTEFMLTDEPDNISKEYIEENLPVSIPMFSCGYKDTETGLTGKELAKKSLVASIAVKLFASESSALYKKLYNEGLINDSFYDDISLCEDYGFVQFGGESSDPVKVGEYIKEEAERVKKEGFDNSDFLRMKNHFYGKYIKSFNNIEAVGNAFCANYFLGIGIFDFLEVYDDVKVSDVNECARKLFDSNRFVMSVVKEG